MSRLRLNDVRIGPIAGSLIGLVAFFLVANPHILAPTNIAWLQGGDPSSHYLTWATYRHGPWTIPLGNNPAYGLELASSVLFNDAIPLLAMSLKPLSPYLSEPFQYFGLWILACFLLQGFFAWKLGEVLELPVIARGLLTALLVLAPPFLWRLHGHFALFAQWLVLAALYLYLRPAPKTLSLAWPALLALSSIVQPYLLLMAGTIWAADLVKRRWLGQIAWRNMLYEAGLSIGLVAICLWMAGFFVVERGLGRGGYGSTYHLDLLEPLNPREWSRLLTDFPYRASPGASIYFGLGMLVLMVWTIPPLLKGSAAPLLKKRVLPLFVALLGLTLYALTYKIRAGDVTLVTIQLPDWALDMARTFRSAGRITWPIYYAIFIGVVWLIVKDYGARLGTALLAAAFLIQVADTSAGWPPFQRSLSPVGSTWSTPLRSPFWSKAAERYKKLRSIPAKDIGKDWHKLGYFALTHGLQTDSVYFSRTDQAALQRLQTANDTLERTHELDGDTLYVFEWPGRAKALQTGGSDDIVAEIDGLWIVAPDGATLAREAGIERRIAAVAAALTPPLAEPILFKSGLDTRRYLGPGWYTPENTGVWSDGPTASLVFHQPHVSRRDLRLVFEVKGYTSEQHDKQHVTAAVGAQSLGEFDLDMKAQEITVVVPVDLIDSEGFFRLDFHIAHPKDPGSPHAGKDLREIGLRLIGLKVYGN